MSDFARIAALEARLAALETREGIATVKPWTPISGGVVYVDASGTGALTTEAAFTYDDVNDELIVGRARLTEQATPGTPPNPYAILFANSAGTLSGIDDAGLVKQMVQRVDGTWTPTYRGLTTAGVTTYTTQQGNYSRFDRLIIAQFEITWTAATGTGVAAISLPFTAVAATEYAMPIYPSNITYAGGPPYALVNTATDYMVMGTPTSNAATATLAVEAAGTVFGTAIYFAA
jgi:hypothetical protein